MQFYWSPWGLGTAVFFLFSGALASGLADDYTRSNKQWWIVFIIVIAVLFALLNVASWYITSHGIFGLPQENCETVIRNLVLWHDCSA